MFFYSFYSSSNRISANLLFDPFSLSDLLSVVHLTELIFTSKASMLGISEAMQTTSFHMEYLKNME